VGVTAPLGHPIADLDHQSVVFDLGAALLGYACHHLRLEVSPTTNARLRREASVRAPPALQSRVVAHDTEKAALGLIG
jgi:hypothetical protein